MIRVLTGRSRFLAVAFVGVWGAPGFVEAQASAAPSGMQGQVVTTGMGQVQVTSDRATISVGVQTRADPCRPVHRRHRKRQQTMHERSASSWTHSRRLESPPTRYQRRITT